MSTADAAVAAGSGSSTENVLPTPGSLSTQMRPPINSTRRAEMVKPSPVPPKRRVVLVSAWVNFSNTV